MTVPPQYRLAELLAETASSVPNDALSLEEAAATSGQVFLDTVLRQHLAVSLRGRPAADPAEAYAWLGQDRVQHLRALVEFNRDPKASDIIAEILRETFRDTSRSFLDTHEIPRLLHLTVCTAILAYTEWPALCRHWIEGGTPALVGDRVIALVHRKLMIDEEWTIRHPDGFSWIGHRLEQRVQYSAHFWSLSIWGTIVSSTTPLVRQVTAARETVLEALSLFNTFASGSMLCFDETQRTITMVAHYFIHEETLDFRGTQHADFSILQLCEAEILADMLASVTGGEAAVSAHPVQGLRDVPDEMLTVIEKLFVPAGEERSRFASQVELEQAMEKLPEEFVGKMSPDFDWIAAGTTLDDDAVVHVHLNAKQQHPRYGSGLSIATVLTLPYDVPVLRVIAHRLSELQRSEDEGRGYGAWALVDLGSGSKLAFCRFIPNLLFKPGVAADAMMCEVNHAWWLRHRMGAIHETARLATLH